MAAAAHSSDDVVIRFDDVSKDYPSYQHIGGVKNLLFRLPRVVRSLRQRHQALQSVSLDIRRGECFGFWGRNGAGKSTALGLIAGVLVPTKGRVTVKGRVTPLLQLGAGFHPDLTGRENILLNGMLLGMTRTQVSEREELIVAFADIGDFIDEPIRTYSSGMLTRLGFSVAIHADPEIMLLDEILSVGDAAFRTKCAARIAEMREAGITMVLVSHSQAEMATYCDRIAIIAEHRIQAVGKPSDIFSAAAPIMHQD